MSTLAQRSFTGGELSPALYARADLAKYMAGLRTCRNFFIMRHGGASNRPGSQFVGEVKDSSDSGTRLIPFIFNSSQTYVLEFGDQYMRVFKDGVQMQNAAQNISAITNANPCVVTYAGADTYVAGDEVYISGIVGAIGTYLNGRSFKVGTVDTALNTFTLKSMDGTTNINSTTFGAYTSGGTLEEVYEIATPYVLADLAELKYVQSADVVTIVHPNYAPRELARTGDTTWTLTAISFEPTISQPNGGSVSSVTGGANTYRIKVTAVDEETFEESLPGLGQSNSIAGITRANPAVVTYSGTDNFADGDEIYISGVVGMTQVNGVKYVVASVNTGANTFALHDDAGNAVDSTGYTAWSSGGTVALTFIKISAAAAPSTGDPHILAWTAVTGAKEYNIYLEDNGVYGFHGIAGANTFNMTTTTSDETDTPPSDRNPFDGTGNYPSTVAYYQQRLGFANTDNDIEKVWFSKTGLFNNMTVSSPLQDDDAVTFTMVGNQVNEVRSMIDIGKLVIFTAGGEHAVNGDAAGILKPAEVNSKQYSYNGANSRLSPIVIGNTALYLQSRGNIIRDLGFDFESDGYRGNDLTIFSAHLFDDYTLNDWAFQQVPHSILWVVRDDGKLLGLTYIKEHELVAWHQHDFEDATVESVCCVPEGSRDVLYLLIKRVVDGRTVRYVERLSDRQISDIVDATILDSYLSFDGRNTGITTMTLSGSGWTYTDTLTLTSSFVSTFTAADIGNQIVLVDPDDDESVVRCTITAYTSGTVVSVRPNRTVPASLHAVATTDWTRAVDQLTGLWHLEGKDVSIFADGFVVANPHNDSYDVQTVANGQLTLDKPYGVIHVGLPITADIETLNVDSVQTETMVDKQKLISKTTLFVEKTRGGWIGQEPPPDEDTDFLGGLTEIKVRNDEDYDSPVELRTGTMDVVHEATWNDNGRVFVRQTDPVPMSVLAIAPSGFVPVRTA